MYNIEQMTMKKRNLAIVLLDIISSTKFVQKVGALKAAKWLQYHDRMTRSLIYRFDGREIDRSDGFMLSFNRVIDAVNFALHYQENIPVKTKLNTRIGIHWGEIIEVIQDDAFVKANAKSIELEGISKNIAARTMSLCGAGQVLLTKETILKIKNKTNLFTPKNTRYACVGLYKFKGVKEPIAIYAVGSTIESLQPPSSTNKVKRLGGAKKIKSRARDRKLKEWLFYITNKGAFVSFIYLCYIFLPFIFSDTGRKIFNDYLFVFYSLYDLIVGVFKNVLL